MDRKHNTENGKEGINSIKMSIYFFTKEGGVQLPDKQAYPKGKVIMPTNHRHGIRVDKNKEVYFGGGSGQPNLYEAIKKCLKNYGVVIIPKEKSTEYKRLVKATEDIKNKETEF
jgi:biopolymer transport protein ExbD